MQPTRELIDGLFRERILRARRTPPEDKLLAGPRLFEMCCRIVMDGIRHQHPEADEQRLRELFAQRLALQRRLENS